jgi:hypothetical protein
MLLFICREKGMKEVGVFSYDTYDHDGELKPFLDVLSSKVHL